MRSLARISLSLVQLVRAGVPAARSHRPAVNLVNLGPYPRGVNTSRGHPETNGLAPGAGKILFRLVESSSVTSTLIDPSNHDCPASHPVPSHPIQSHPPSPQHDKAPPVRYGLTLDAQRHALILPPGGPVPKGGVDFYTHAVTVHRRPTVVECPLFFRLCRRRLPSFSSPSGTGFPPFFSGVRRKARPRQTICLRALAVTPQTRINSESANADLMSNRFVSAQGQLNPAQAPRPPPDSQREKKLLWAKFGIRHPLDSHASLLIL